MANLLNFKFGQFSKLPIDTKAGTVYVTTDEQAMYIDLPESLEDNASVKRIRIGDIVVKQNAREAVPPFSEGAFYYFVDENALLRWNGSGWTQVNSVSDVQANITDLTKTVNDEISRSKAADETHTQAIAAANEAINARLTIEDFNTFKTSNTAAIADAKKAGTDAATAAQTAKNAADAAQATANTAQANANNRIHKDGSVAMEANLKMGGHGIENLADLTDSSSGKMAANKNYVDAAKTAALNVAQTASEAAQAAQETADSAVDAAGTAQTTANKGVADAAAALAKANEKTTIAEVEAKGYATTGYVDTAKSAVLGKSGDAATAKTVYGAHAAAAAAAQAAQTAQTTANQGVADAATAAEAAATADQKAVAADGKAVAAQNTIDTYITNHENDYTNTQIDDKFTEAKKAGTDAQATANSAVSAAGTAQSAADNAQTDATQALTDAATAQNTIDTYITNHASDYTNGQIDTAVAAAKKAGTDAQGTANTALSTANNALPKAGGTMNSGAEINMNNGSISGLADLTSTSDGKMAVNKNYVDTAIANGLAANDAMTFVGVLGTGADQISSLPSTANVGDTYKVGVAGTYGSITAKVGDLIINGAESDGTPKWIHVSSGYESEYVQKLVNSDNVIHLTNGVSNTATNSVSNFTIIGDADSNLQFTVSGTGNSLTITGSMIWGTFS